MPMGDDLAQHSLEMTTNASRMALELLKLLADFARRKRTMTLIPNTAKTTRYIKAH